MDRQLVKAQLTLHSVVVYNNNLKTKKINVLILDLFCRMPTNALDILCVRAENAGTVKIITLLINCIYTTHTDLSALHSYNSPQFTVYCKT